LAGPEINAKTGFDFCFHSRIRRIANVLWLARAGENQKVGIRPSDTRRAKSATLAWPELPKDKTVRTRPYCATAAMICLVCCGVAFVAPYLLGILNTDRSEFISFPFDPVLWLMLLPIVYLSTALGSLFGLLGMFMEKCGKHRVLAFFAGSMCAACLWWLCRHGPFLYT
jgi:hypothetical protein